MEQSGFWRTIAEANCLASQGKPTHEITGRKIEGGKSLKGRGENNAEEEKSSAPGFPKRKTFQR